MGRRRRSLIKRPGSRAPGADTSTSEIPIPEPSEPTSAQPPEETGPPSPQPTLESELSPPMGIPTPAPAPFRGTGPQHPYSAIDHLPPVDPPSAPTPIYAPRTSPGAPPERPQVPATPHPLQPRVPSGATEDMAPRIDEPYSAPVASPPIPGLFTPAPMERMGEPGHGPGVSGSQSYPLSGSKKRDRPAYIADTPAPTSRFDPDEWAARRARALGSELADEGPSGPPDELLKLMGVVMIGIFSMGIIAIWLTLLWGGPPEEDEGLISREPVAKDVEIREVVRPAPQPAATSDRVRDPSLPAVAPRNGPVVPKPEPQPEPVVAAPPPTPRPRPTKPQPATSGTLKIRSNRKVLVYVNDEAIGYTPQNYPAPPGSYQISAMVPGQPKTRQTHRATLEQGGSTVPVQFTF